MLTYAELKRILYIAQTSFGILLCVLGVHSLIATTDPVIMVAALMESAAGCGLIIFGSLTYILKDDPDVWR